MDNCYFVMTVDTEADDAWEKPDRITLENMKEIPRFQALCDEYRIRPTYLLAYECATRDEALSVLTPIKKTGRCEIGHHLHSWTTPPFQSEDPKGIDKSWLHAYQSELPYNLFVEKSECLREAVERSYGVSPVSHRAGRWGIDDRSIRWLANAGFRVDSSVIPRLSLGRVRGRSEYGPSFLRASRNPYHWYNEGQNNPILEVPVTTGMPASRFGKKLDEMIYKGNILSGAAEKLYRRGSYGRMLRPSPKFTDDDIRGIIDSNVIGSMLVINMIIHSSELARDCSPYTRTKEDHRLVWEKMDYIFRYISKLGLKSITLAETAELI